MKEFSVIALFCIALEVIGSSDAISKNTFDNYHFGTIHMANYGDKLGTFSARSLLACAGLCSETPSCRSAMFDAVQKLCSTNRWTLDPAAMVSCNPGDGCPTSSVREYAKKDVQTTMRQNCSHDNDCVDPMSDCRLGNCACAPGFSYNRTTYSCVTECTHYGTTFQMIPGKKLDYNNEESYIAPSFEHCANTCISATKYVCRSIEFKSTNHTNINCFLSSITAVIRPDLYRDSSLVDLYTRDCS